MQRKRTAAGLVLALACVSAGAAAASGGGSSWRVTVLPVPAHTTTSFSEPGLAVGPGGVLVANACTANAGGPSTFWRSRDFGRTWSTGFPVGASAIGCGDADAVLGSDGWFYSLTLGTGVDVYRSRDGKHWSGPASFPPPHGTDQPDRPWFVTFPRHPNQVLMLNSEVGGNIVAWRSTDHAKTFTGPVPVTGGANSEAGLTLGSRPLVDPRDDTKLHMFYETVGGAALSQSANASPSQFPLSQLWEASSDDGGQTWASTEVLDVTTAFGVDTGSIGHLLPATAIDRNGTIYVVLSVRLGDAGATHLYLIHSVASGWSKPVRVDRGVPSNVFPAIALSAPGHLYISWYSSSSPDFDASDARWFESFASTTTGLTAHPRFAQRRLGNDTPVHVGGIDNAGNVGFNLGQNWGLRDFQAVVVDRCGHPHVTWARDYKGARTYMATTTPYCSST